MTLNETCDELRSYLQSWYDRRKAAGRMDPYELCEAKNAFLAANPECGQYDGHFYYEFIAVASTYSPPCFCGYCDWFAHVRVKGVRGWSRWIGSG